MNRERNDIYKNIDDDSIDILDLLKKVWDFRKLVFKVTLFSFITGCFVAILIPEIFTSKTTFVPQVSDDKMPISSNIGSIASLAGIKINQNQSTSDSYLSPLLYTKIIDSEEFSLKLLSEDLINLNNEKFTVKEYLLSQKSSLNFNPINFIKKYTIDLILNKESDKVDNDLYYNYNFISQEDYSLLKSLRKKFTIDINEKDGYIIVFASDKNSFISSQLVKKITKSLQSKIIEIRTNKIRERLKFSKEQYDIKQLEFDLLHKELAEFKDSNKNISTASFRSKLQKLESEYQLQQNILINLASEFNNNKIKLNKDTPIFSVIDEVSIPNVRSKPNRVLVVIIFTFIGLIFSTAFVLTKGKVINLIKEIKN